MSTKAQYLLAFRLFRMNIKPYTVTHRWNINPIIATRAWEALHSV